MFQACIYQTNSNATGGATGQYMGFPSANILVRPVIPALTVQNSVVVNSIIQLLPSGTVVNQPQYYSDRTVAQIITLATA